jgi:hypothetical protein
VHSIEDRVSSWIQVNSNSGGGVDEATVGLDDDSLTFQRRISARNGGEPSILTPYAGGFCLSLPHKFGIVIACCCTLEVGTAVNLF